MRVLVLLMVLASIVSMTPVFADTSCQPIYGGGQTCVSSNISIEKDVVNPATNTDVHDLGENDPKFHAGDTVTFHITIQNTGSNSMNGATITDNFPQFVTFVSGPGNFDTTNKSLSFPVGTLAPNQSQTFTVIGRIVDASQLPSVQPNCVVNNAVVLSNNQQTAQDSSQFCLEAPAVLQAVTSVPAQPQAVQSPATGASPVMLAFLSLLGITGVYVQELTKRRSQ